MTDTAPLDTAALQELRTIMGDEFDLLIGVFFSDSEQRLLDIAAAIARQDAEALRTTAHGFKGSALNISAARLTELCRRLEEMGRTGQLEQAGAVLQAVQQEFDRVRAYLQSP
ncbi:MAG TPA: Hpt domain-containing protein [Pseudomonadales bacterium]